MGSSMISDNNLGLSASIAKIVVRAVCMCLVRLCVAFKFKFSRPFP